MTHCVARNTAGKMSKLQPKLAVSCLAAVSHKINVSMVCRNVQSQHFILCIADWAGFPITKASQQTRKVRTLALGYILVKLIIV